MLATRPDHGPRRPAGGTLRRRANRRRADMQCSQSGTAHAQAAATPTGEKTMTTAPPIAAIKTKTDDKKPVREAIGRAVETIVSRFGKGALMALGGDARDIPKYE